MSNWRRRLLGLGLPCLYALLLDAGLTLHGQPAEYWAGDYAETTEGAPFYAKLYQRHPAAAIGGYVLWASLIGGMLVLLPEPLAVVLAIAVVFGHTGGAYTWVIGMLLRANGSAANGWYQVANGMFLLSSAVVGVGVHWEVRSAALRGPKGSASRISGPVRWCLVATLVGVAAAVVFAPW